jgi:histidinol-phosphatase (PHP family)
MHLRGPAVDGAEPLVHTVEAVERYVEAAAARGVDEIAFTEHVYYFAETREIWEHPYHAERCVYSLDAYCDAVLEGTRNGLPVKLGLEIDRVAGRQERLAELLAPYPWDVLLGSVHDLGAAALDLRPGVWQSLPVEEVWRRYVAEACALVASGAVDVLAHPDLPKVFGDRPSPEAEAQLAEELAAACAAAGVAAEISTAGLRKPVRELYPSPVLLAAFRRHGVPVTLASDAHQAELVGDGLDRAAAAARAAGYDTVTVLDGRIPRQEPLS